MDYTSLLLAIGITAYGILAYRRRDREYRNLIRKIAKRQAPEVSLERPVLGKIVTVSVTAVLLLSMSAWCFSSIWTRSRYASALVVIGLFMSGILTFLVLMMIRDIREYRTHPKS
jgi:hypothetical protein